MNYANAAQVAGHPDGMRFEGALVLKRLQTKGKHDGAAAMTPRREAAPSRGDKEALLLLETAPGHSFLKDRVPRAHEIRTEADGGRWLVMDSLTGDLKSPAILDVKMGSLTYGPDGATLGPFPIVLTSVYFNLPHSTGLIWVHFGEQPRQQRSRRGERKTRARQQSRSGCGSAV